MKALSSNPSTAKKKKKKRTLSKPTKYRITGWKSL
jgi:hypothetical protein